MGQPVEKLAFGSYPIPDLMLRNSGRFGSASIVATRPIIHFQTTAIAWPMLLPIVRHCHAELNSCAWGQS